MVKVAKAVKSSLIMVKDGSLIWNNMVACLLTPNVELLEYEGVLIPKAKLIGVDDEVKRRCYTFLVSSNVHHLFPNDRVMLCADGSDTYQIGTIEKVNKDSMVICMDRPLPQGEFFSIELIG